jgi:hypothetical protein
MFGQFAGVAAPDGAPDGAPDAGLVDDGAFVDGVDDEGAVVDGVDVAAYAAAPPPSTAPARAPATRTFRRRDFMLFTSSAFDLGPSVKRSSLGGPSDEAQKALRMRRAGAGDRLVADPLDPLTMIGRLARGWTWAP